VVWVGQRLTVGVASIGDVILAIEGADVDFENSGVEAGCVVTVSGVSYEVIERISPTELVVSRLRIEGAAAPIVPTPVTDAQAWVVSFRPQIEMVHRQVLAMLGLAVNGSGAGQLTEADITNPGELKRLEALGTLHLIFSSASAAAGSPMNERAQMYRELFGEERQRVRAMIDTNGDGEADVVRRPSVGQLVRG